MVDMNSHAAKTHLSPLLLPQSLCDCEDVVMLYLLTYPHSHYHWSAFTLPVAPVHTDPASQALAWAE
jgi:hypothetical protein